MPSFDIVSEVNHVEIKNAVDQCNKEVTNRWFETMGIVAAMAAANDLDAMGIAGPGMDDFTAVWREGGVRPAVRMRDKPFSEHRTYWEAYQASRAKKPQGGL